MAIKFIDDSILTAIANAIRTKLSSSDTYKPSEMATAIGSISGGGITPTGTISITTNGTTDVTQYASANVQIPASAVDSGTKSINSNGTHDVVGYASASVSVPNSYSAGDEGKVVSNGALVAQSSDSVTQNGTVDTTLINSLTVNVSGGNDRIFTLSNSLTIDNYAEVASKILSLNKVLKAEILIEDTKLWQKMTLDTIGNGNAFVLDLKGERVWIDTSGFNTGNSTNAIKKITCDEDSDFVIALKGTASQALRSCKLLEEIHPKLLLALTGNYSSTWNQSGQALTYVRCVPNVLEYDFGFDNSSLLTDESIVSIANALKDGITGHSIKFHATPKARCNSIMGTVSQVTEGGVTYNLFTANAQGATTLTSFITTTKGWTLA